MASVSDWLSAILGGQVGQLTPNQYVANNWPSDGRHLLHTTHPETFYTPFGYPVPPGGRRESIHEMIHGAPTARDIANAVQRVMDRER